jgi:hypothetical protein
MAYPDRGVSVTSLTSVSDAIKTVYAKWLISTLNNEWKPLKRMQRAGSDVEMGAAGVTFYVKYGRTGSARAGSETGVLPSPGILKGKQVTQTMAQQFGTVAWTEKIMALADSDVKSFVRQAEGQMTDLKDAMLANLSRQIMGNGAGYLATLTAVSDGTSASTTNILHVDNVQHFEIGQRVVVVSTSDFTSSLVNAGTYLNVIAVDIENKLAYWGANDAGTTATTSGTAIGNRVIIYGSNTGTTTGTCETTGMQQFGSDSSTLHSLDVATYPWWKGQVVQNGAGVNAPLDLENLDRLIDNIEDIRGGKVSVLYMHPRVKQQIIKLIRQRQDFVGEGTVDAAVKTEAYRGIPLISDRSVADNTIFAMDERYIKFAEAGKLRWGDRSGSMFHLLVDSSGYYPAWFSFMEWDCQMICTNRVFQGQLTYVDHA